MSFSEAVRPDPEPADEDWVWWCGTCREIFVKGDINNEDFLDQNGEPLRCPWCGQRDIGQHQYKELKKYVRD